MKWLGFIAVAIVILAIIGSFGTSPDNGNTFANSSENARSICSAFEGTESLSGPCRVSSSSKSINVTMNTSVSEAQKICRGVTRQINQSGIRLEHGWKLKIYSVHSSASPIAECYF